MKAEPFRFCTELRLIESTGISVRTLAQLLDALRKVPGAAIFYHTHQRCAAHHFQKPVVYNDFAIWVGESLQERALAERLAAIDLRSFVTIRKLREAIIAEVEAATRNNHRLNRECPPGDEFHFSRSRSFVMSTGIVAQGAPDFFLKVAAITTNALYFHFLQAPLRLGRATNDFSEWLTSLGQDQLANAINQLDPYRTTLDELKEEIVNTGRRFGAEPE